MARQGNLDRGRSPTSQSVISSLTEGSDRLRSGFRWRPHRSQSTASFRYPVSALRRDLCNSAQGFHTFPVGGQGAPALLHQSGSGQGPLSLNRLFDLDHPSFFQSRELAGQIAAGKSGGALQDAQSMGSSRVTGIHVSRLRCPIFGLGLNSHLGTTHPSSSARHAVPRLSASNAYNEVVAIGRVREPVCVPGAL